MAQDYKTRLTADTSQHDNALKRSAQQVYQYKKKTEEAKVTLGKLVGKFAPLAAQIGIAGGALGTLKKMLTSTEQGSDALDRAMYTAKSSVDRFFQSISSGSFNAFTDGLHEITKAAREAYNALDDLGTMRMWNNADIEKQRTIIAKNRTIIYDRNATAAQKKAAQQAIDDAIKEIERLNGNLIKQSNKASNALLREYAGTTRVTITQLEQYRKMLKEGTLAEHAAKFKQQHSYETYDYVTMDANAPASKMYYTKWNDKNSELLYNVMQSYLTLPEDKWQALLDIETQNEQRMQQLEQMKQQAERTAGRAEGSSNSTPKIKVETEIEPLPEGSIAALEEQISNLNKSFRLAATDEDRQKFKQQIEEAQAELDKLLGKEKKIEIQPVIPEGSIAYLQLQLKALRDQFENTPDAELRIKLMADMSELERQLKDMQTTEAEKAAEALTKRLQNMQNEAQATASAFDAMGNVFTNLGGCFDETAQQFLSGVGSIISSIGAVMPQIASLIAAEEGEAMASGLAGAAKVEPWPAKVAAIASIVAQILGVIGTIASISKFADGGIIGGATSIGDYNLARVNRGEMILNSRQQQHLFNLLNGGTQAHDNSNGGNVTFTIHGHDLQGTLNNYNRKTGRVR